MKKSMSFNFYLYLDYKNNRLIINSSLLELFIKEC